uniref:Ubiquitin-like domain-containing protein n=1 Tax=Florenciella parvula TaxID=236787 RepID=A0A7S2BVR5_9STRA
MAPPPQMQMSKPPPPAAPPAGGTGGGDGAPGGEPDAKRARLDTGLQSEADFAASCSGPVELQFSLPTDATVDSAWQMDGRTVPMAVDVMLTIKQLKEKLGAEKFGGMPASKYQLKDATLGFLKDRLTIAHYNLKTATLEVVLKKRGR